MNEQSVNEASGKDKKHQIRLNDVRAKLRTLTSRKQIFFTRRCNKSISLAVSMALRKLRYDGGEDIALLIQEEGGWITYANEAKKNNLSLHKISMSDGKMQLNNLEEVLNKYVGRAILLIHSMPGYSYEEDMSSIYTLVKKHSGILINDSCGSIGSNSATIGDIIVCSFGKAKPLSAGGGGFIASDNFDFFLKEDEFNSLEKEEVEALGIIDLESINSAIDSLKDRLHRWKQISELTKEDLIKRGFTVLNMNNNAINVLVAFTDNDEKERLINYSKEHNLEYTLCPRYIRTIKQALSLEIKRK
jgi:dTDP-4-amino-4,6-dideoxygalactose transaminase